MACAAACDAEDFEPPVAERVAAVVPLHREFLADAPGDEEEAPPRAAAAASLATRMPGAGAPAESTLLELALPAMQGEDVEEPTYTLRWDGLVAGEGEAAKLALDVEQVGLVVTNASATAVEVELRVTGDTGTTLDLLVLEQVVEVAATSKEIVTVELASLLGKSDFEFSGHLRASAVVHTPEGLERIASPSAFFHPTGEGSLQLYDALALELEHAKGDLLAQEDVIDGEDAIEPGFTYRVLRWAEPVDAKEAMALTESAAVAAPPEESGPPAAVPAELAIPPAQLLSYTACFRWEIETRDSNNETWTGGPEDIWTDANDPTVVPAYGVRVKIGSTTYDTSPSSGCVTFQAALSVQSVRVYEFAMNSYDTYARIHNGPRYEPGAEGEGDYYPGATYNWYVAGVHFIPNSTVTIDVGDHILRTTGMAAISYALMRYAYGVSHSAYHVALDPLSDRASHYNSQWPTNGDHDSAYLQFPSDPLKVDSDRKFIVAHEYGHAFGAFFGPHQLFSTNYSYAPNNAGGGFCYNGGANTHGINSMEWSHDAAYEGWANFVSAMVWNYGPSEFGSYVGHEMASFEAGGFYGGWEENHCLPCPECPWDGDGTGVESDWMRAFWDFYTNDRTECSNPPSSTDVARFWGNLLDLGLDHPEGWEGSVDAVQQLAADGHVGGCFATRWYWKGGFGDDSISHWNGLRQEWPY